MTKASFSRAWLAALLLCGCSAEGYARVERPGVSPTPAPNRVWVASPVWDERDFGLPRNAFASEASLVRLDGGGACFDVIVRSWSGADGNWRVALDVDGREVSQSGWMPFKCTDEDPCLPRDTTLRGLATDADRLVSARGSRLCFRHIVGRSQPVRTLTLSATQGGATLDFHWHLVPSGSPSPVGYD